MALYRLSVSIVGRGAGRSAVASAAYRAAERLAEFGDRPADALGAAAYRSGDVLAGDDGAVVHDYSRKAGVVHSEILAPDDAPVWMHDRERLWNAVEASEKRKDAQLAREIQLALPRGLSRDDQLELVRGFAQSQLVARGMVVDVALHDTRARDGQRQPHAHLLLTMRRIEPEARLGFGTKERAWNGKELLQGWRETWAEEVNRALERQHVAERVDHRTLEAQRRDAVGQGDWQRAAALDREPEPKLGYAAAALERQGIATERGDLWRGVHERNAERRVIYDLVAGFGERAQDAFLSIRERAGDAIAAFDGWVREATAHARDWLGERVVAVADTAGRVGRFAGLRLDAGPASPAAPVTTALEERVAGYARAWADADRMRAASLPVLPHQAVALDQAAAALHARATNLHLDLAATLDKAPDLARDAGSPNGARALLAAAGSARRERLVLEERARGVVRTWGELERAYGAAEVGWDRQAQREIAGRMETMARELKQDTTLDRVLKERGRELGMAGDSRLERVVQMRKITQALTRELRLGHSQDLGLER